MQLDKRGDLNSHSLAVFFARVFPLYLEKENSFRYDDFVKADLEEGNSV